MALRPRTTLPPKMRREVDIFVEDYQPHYGENRATVRIAFSDAGRDMIMHYGINALVGDTLDTDWDGDNLSETLF